MLSRRTRHVSQPALLHGTRSTSRPRLALAHRPRLIGCPGFNEQTVADTNTAVDPFEHTESGTRQRFSHGLGKLHVPADSEPKRCRPTQGAPHRSPLVRAPRPWQPRSLCSTNHKRGRHDVPQESADQHNGMRFTSRTRSGRSGAIACYAAIHDTLFCRRLSSAPTFCEPPLPQTSPG